MVAFTYAAIQVILWQSADISVNIVSNGDEGNNEVSISVLNTAGATLLFYENDQVSGKIEYLSENGWVEYCDVCYTSGNVQAVSPEYGGLFAELAPGENWKVTVPDDKVGDMKNGTYRIKMTYITENNYNKYLEMAYKETQKNNDVSIESSLPMEESSKAPEIVGTTDIIEESLDDVSDESDASFDVSEDKGEVIAKEKFLAEAYSEVFYKTFEYSAPEKMLKLVSDISEISQ